MEQQPRRSASTKSRTPPLARTVLIGVVLLAVAAVAIAWADATGLTSPILRALQSARY